MTNTTITTRIRRASADEHTAELASMFRKGAMDYVERSRAGYAAYSPPPMGARGDAYNRGWRFASDLHSIHPASIA